MKDGTDGTMAAETDYLRLRCGILDQIDRDMYRHRMSAASACGRAEEAFGIAGTERREWTWSVLLGVLALRDPSALPRWAEEAAAVRRWMESEAFAALPQRVREWAERDSRLAGNQD